MRILPWLVLLALATPAAAEDWVTKRANLERYAADSTHVFLGTLAREGARATFAVERNFKGAPRPKLTVTLSSEVDAASDPKPNVYFLVPDGDGLRVICKWDGKAWRTARRVVFRADQHTRFPGMQMPPANERSLALGLGALDARGIARQKVKLASREALQSLDLVLQFENAGRPVAVMPCLDGSTFSWRYPYYKIELVDAAGKPVPRPRRGVCKTTNPLQTRDVVTLGKGGVLRTTAPWMRWELAPGTYRVRIHYTAKRDARNQNIRHSEDPAGALAALKTVWEGELVSNWVEIEIAAKR